MFTRNKLAIHFSQKLVNGRTSNRISKWLEPSIKKEYINKFFGSEIR